MKERNYDVVKTVVGILLAAIGFVLLRRYADSQGVMAVLPFVCIGVGCGAFGHGMGGMLSRKALNRKTSETLPFPIPPREKPLILCCLSMAP